MFAIIAVYEQYKQDVFVYLVSITHNTTLSQDLVSETFHSAIKSLSSFEGKSDIKTWLFSIARYKWYEYLRKEKPTISLDDLTKYYICDECEPDEIVAQNEVARRISQLLLREDTRTRDIVLRRIEGYSFYEIAKKWGISEGSARVIDFRTKKKLKEMLTREGFEYE
ncbi:sigma-70 family RNA polymerase sigma factor [Alkalibaculum sp. M08DMB]|uniref:Sigma-70 family RNA polymerase sigma factor n=1 Tax=Alkalibaculum sporogenes TaxID=2655001 RepID=A0A6A7K438_9FIRM|nr:RNA polymerase sigma factor [Alkalibaculum sporogenes]MPW24222.1 sigma-70 family RNA polymerase sigma factor [Alkalibaculum sporogenes]